MGLRASATGVLVASVFAIALGFGLLLPVLPSLLDRLVRPPTVGWHIGLLTGTYSFALFLFAPVWGYVSDRWQRRGVIVLGLAGFAIALAVFSFIEMLPALYAGQFLSGTFSAAVLPGAQALIADVSQDDHWRARRFALLSGAYTAGLFFGPVVGGALGDMWSEAMPPTGVPFLAIAAGAGLLAPIAWRVLPLVGDTNDAGPSKPEYGSRADALRPLLFCAFVLAVGLGTFEVGITLRGIQQLGLRPGQVGLILAECMAVMIVAQAMVFNPWVTPTASRWLLAPAFVLLAVALLLLPTVQPGIQLYLAVGALAAAAGVLTPVVAFWASLAAGNDQGRELGRQTAALSLGQTVGATAAGFLFGTIWLTESAFLLAATVALAGAGMALALAFRLATLAPPAQRRRAAKS